jgi:hypothetical protein
MERDGAMIDGWYYPLDDLIEDDDGHIVLRPGVIPMGERNATAAPARPKHVVVPERGALVDGWYYPAHDLMVNKAGKVVVRPGVPERGLVADGVIADVVDKPTTADTLTEASIVGELAGAGGDEADQVEAKTEAEVADKKQAPGPHKEAGDKMVEADKGGTGGARGNGGSKPPATGTTYSTKG